RRRETSAALNERENRFRALIEHNADGIATIDRDGRYLYQSPSAQRILGFDSASLLGQSYLDYVHPDDKAIAQRDFEAIRDNPGHQLVSEFRVRHADSSWRWFSTLRSNLLHDPDVGAIVSNYRDVTIQHEAVRALRESEERFREMAEHIKEAFFVTDLPSRKPLYVSPTWAEIWGRPLSDGYDAENWHSSIHPDDHAAV